VNIFSTILILAAAFLTVFGEAAFQLPRQWFGAQVDLLPALMVYAALKEDIVTISLLAVCGGLWFDSLSVNPLGITILPLFAVGFAIWFRRDLIMREVPFAQIILGTVASAIAPALTVLLLLTSGRELLLGWGSLWQWLVMAAGGALATPIIFYVFEWCHDTLGYQPVKETSFRPDREILRDKKLK
jgi:rod shape-determining protein MreD